MSTSLRFCWMPSKFSWRGKRVNPESVADRVANRDSHEHAFAKENAHGTQNHRSDCDTLIDEAAPEAGSVREVHEVARLGLAPEAQGCPDAHTRLHARDPGRQKEPGHEIERNGAGFEVEREWSSAWRQKVRVGGAGREQDRARQRAAKPRRLRKACMPLPRQITCASASAPRAAAL